MAIAWAWLAIAAPPADPVGHKFWVGSTPDALPILFGARDERTGIMLGGRQLKDGQTVEVEGIDDAYGIKRYRLRSDDGQELFLSLDEFQRSLYSPAEYRREGADVFNFNQHLFEGPPGPILAEAKARDAAAAAAWRKRPDARIGMTAAEALRSKWGAPDHINRTTTAHGVREQWVYAGGGYLYFDDGILVAAQN